MLRTVLCLLALGACARDHRLADAGPGELDFEIGDIDFHVASGTARVEGTALGLYLTDQPDACLAITRLPTGSYTVFRLGVVPRADGVREATVALLARPPAPGEAVGAIGTYLGPERTGGHDADSGTVSWRPNDDGTTTLLSVDVGFAGVAGRIAAQMLTVPGCP
jgi:hypothetical protein